MAKSKLPKKACMIPSTNKMHGWAEKGNKSKRVSRKRTSGK